MVMLNLVYRDQVPDFAKTYDKSLYDDYAAIIFFGASAINHNSLYFTIIILFPTYAAGAFAQQLVISDIYASETSYYPPGLPRITFQA